MKRDPVPGPREIKLDLLKTLLHQGSICPHSTPLKEIQSWVAKHERSLVTRWVNDLVSNENCPLRKTPQSNSEFCLIDRQLTLEYIQTAESDPWYDEGLDS